MALKAQDGFLRVAYAYHQDTYATSNIGFQANASGTWQEEILALQAPTTNSIDLAIDDNGHNHVTTCDVGESLRYYTDQSGVWTAHLIPSVSCYLSYIDSQYANGRVFVAYQGPALPEPGK